MKGEQLYLPRIPRLLNIYETCFLKVDPSSGPGTVAVPTHIRSIRGLVVSPHSRISSQRSRIFIVLVICETEPPRESFLFIIVFRPDMPVSSRPVP